MRPPLALAPVVIAALLRLALAVQPLDRLDRLFIPDDTYYTLSVARSLANGLGPTADGVTPTSGFQPLLAFAMVPAFASGISADAAVRGVVLLAALFDVCCVAMLFLVVDRVFGRAAAFCSALLWAISPYAIANALGGLETSLALMNVLLLLAAFGAYDRHPSAPLAAALGATAALAWLARVDTVAVAALAGAVVFYRHRVAAHLIPAAAAFALIVGPWWWYELRHFGSVVPESGAAVRAQVAFHQALYLTPRMQAAWAAGYLTTAPFLEVRWWRELLFRESSLGAAVFLTGWMVAAFALRRSLATRRRAESVHILWAFGLIVALFYTFYVPALWFFRRYLAPAEAALAVAFGVAIATLYRRGGVVHGVAVAAMICAAAVTTVQMARWTRMHPAVMDVALEGSKGYREPALAILAAVPDGAVIGAFQSGALAYYAWPQRTVVNLDGVVDRAAHHAIVEGRLRDYARERGIRWFADWPFNRSALEFFSARATTPAPVLAEIYRGPLRGTDQAILWTVTWR